MLPQLDILDGQNKEGMSVMSEDDEDEEEGEFDLEQVMGDQVFMNSLDPETREKLKNGELDEDDLRGLGMVPDDFDDEGGEGGEMEFAEDEFDGEEEGGLGKRTLPGKFGGDQGEADKRQKDE